MYTVAFLRGTGLTGVGFLQTVMTRQRGQGEKTEPKNYGYDSCLLPPASCLLPSLRQELVTEMNPS